MFHVITLKLVSKHAHCPQPHFWSGISQPCAQYNNSNKVHGFLHSKKFLDKILLRMNIVKKFYIKTKPTISNCVNLNDDGTKADEFLNGFCNDIHLIC